MSRLLPKLTGLDYVFQLFHLCFLSSLLGFLPCRDYRRYFYTHKLTSKTQWDYPDADEISTEETRAAEGVRETRVKERDGEISSTTRSGDRRAPDSSYSKFCLQGEWVYFLGKQLYQFSCASLLNEGQLFSEKN